MQQGQEASAGTMQLMSQMRQEWREDFDQLRDDIDAKLGQLPPAGRIQERWTADTAHFDRLDGQVAEVQRDVLGFGRVLPTLATTEAVRQVVREELAGHPDRLAVEHLVENHVKQQNKGFITTDQLTNLLAEQRRDRQNEFRTIITWAMGILVAAQVLGIVNFARIFGH